MSAGTRLELPPITVPSTLGTRLAARSVVVILGVIGALVLVSIVVACAIPIRLTVQASGILEESQAFPVRLGQGGFVMSVLVRNGDVVEKGDPLVTLDTADLAYEANSNRHALAEAELAVARARAAVPVEQRTKRQRYSQAEARTVEARATLRDRLGIFRITGPIDSIRQNYVVGTHVEIDRAIATLTAAEADEQSAREDLDGESLAALDVVLREGAVASLQARSEELRERISRRIVRASVAGDVVTLHPELLVGTSVRPGDEVISVADTRRWKATFSLHENKLRRINVGDSVALNVPALGPKQRRPLWAVVTFIASAPLPAQGGRTLASGSGTFEVSAALLNESLDAGAEPSRGFTADGHIVTRSVLVATLIREYIAARVRNARSRLGMKSAHLAEPRL
jgi:multidrug resistance efflux pump